MCACYDRYDRAGTGSEQDLLWEENTYVKMSCRLELYEYKEFLTLLIYEYFVHVRKFTYYYMCRSRSVAGSKFTT